MADFLDTIIDQYLSSGDFNGYHLHVSTAAQRQQATDLVEQGLVQVVSEEDYLNPHIRPWKSKRSIEDQVRSVSQSGEGYGVCLYPTSDALKDRLPTGLFADQPYRRRLAEGGGTLELAYFRFDVLESYRNDPRFEFVFHDFGARATISNEAYDDDSEPDHDKTSISHIGFAYDLSHYDTNDPDTPIIRRVCAFLGDLADLTALHQLRWSTYEVPRDDTLSPHPIWWRQQMGHWPDGLGPFERFFFELRSWNELHKGITGIDLLKNVERPREFGWILRPSQHEFDHFVQQLDKLLSDNVQHSALDELGVARKDSDGRVMGTLQRLDWLLESRKISAEGRRGVLKPLRDVRSARQRPAHSVVSNVNSNTFVRQQADLLERVNESLYLLRTFWQQHPANKGWQEPDYADEGKGYRL